MKQLILGTGTAIWWLTEPHSFIFCLNLFISIEWNSMALSNVSNCLDTNIYSYLETSGGKSYILYLIIVHFFNTSVN